MPEERAKVAMMRIPHTARLIKGDLESQLDGVAALAALSISLRMGSKNGAGRMMRFSWCSMRGWFLARYAGQAGSAAKAAWRLSRSSWLS